MAARAQNVVVGYDGSDSARRALDRAADLVDGYGSTLAVVSVAARDARGQAESLIGEARERLHARQVTARYVEPVGDPAEMLVEAADDLGADLLVVGRRDHNALQRLVLGSVSSQVLRRAGCDVLVVR